MMDVTKLRFIVGCLGVASVLWVIGAAAEPGAQQRPPRPGTIEPTSPSTPPRPGALETDIPAPPPPAQGKVTRIVIPSTKGFLILFTTARSNVVLRKLGPHGPQGEPYKPEDKGGGILIFSDLQPSKYKLEILRDKYEKLADTIAIKAGQPTVLNAPLIPRFVAVGLTMGELDKRDVKVKLDDRELKAEELTIGKDDIIINEVSVGKHNLAVSKDGYKPRSWPQYDVTPGKHHIISATLEKATVRLTVSSLPDARVYVTKYSETGRVLRGQVNGQIPVQIDLTPDDYKLSVELDGYETFGKQIKLGLDKPSVEEMVNNLDPIADPETSDDFTGNYWCPSTPGAWQIEGGRGRLIKGDGVALFCRGQKDTHPFNYYSDFTLVFKVAFNNQKGAAWIARARDEKNYYLFELTTSRSSRGERRFIFSVCKDGKCVEKLNELAVVHKIETPNDVLTIKLVGSGKKLSHFIDVPSDPTDKMRPLGSVITDETFKWGGVGLCGASGVEMNIKQFLVMPRAVSEQ